MATKDYLNKNGLEYYHSKAKTEFENVLNQDGTVSATGSSIEIDNALEEKLVDLTLYGNTEQDGTPTPESPVNVEVVTGRNEVGVKGKNLFDISKWTNVSLSRGTIAVDTENNTITLSNTDGGDLYTISGGTTSSGSTLGETYRQYLTEINPNKSYTLSFTKTSNETDDSGYDSCYYCLYDENYVSLGYTSFGSKEMNVTSEVHFTTNANVKYIGIRLGVRTSQISVTYNNIQLEENPTLTSYEPYQNNTYEINLGKNLFDKDNANILNGYIDNNIIYLDTAQLNRMFYIPCKTNTTYTISRSVSTTTFRVATYDSTPIPNVTSTGTTYPVTGMIKENDSNTITITTGENAKYLLVHYGRLETDPNISESLPTIQIELGSTATDYAPYFEPIELCKIGDYKDKIYKENNKWYLRKEIEKYVFDGTEDWRLESSGRFNCVTYQSFTRPPAANNVLGNAVSNKFVINTASNTWNDATTSFSVDTSGNINVRYDDYITLESFKNWMAEDNFNVYVALAAPTTTEITNTELISQLEAISTLTGKNYIDLDCVEGNALASVDITAYTNSVNGKYESLKNSESSVDLSNYYTKEEVDAAIASAPSGSVTKYRNLTLSTSNWVQNSTTNLYEYSIEDTNVTSKTLVNGYMDIENQSKLSDGYILSSNGSFKIITSTLPTESIIITVTYEEVVEV